MNKMEHTINNMLLLEKINMLSGLDFWHLKPIDVLGIPPLMITDGPHGLRKQVLESSQIGLNASKPSTCFPTAVALAASWNTDLLYRIGVALGEACLQEDVVAILGPGINLKRSPLCGRNFEYYSEDPYLTSEMAIHQVKGTQSKGVGAAIKHYVANHQEKLRMVMNAQIDNIALTDLYLYAFKRTIEHANPDMIMTSYNKVNGHYVSEHPVLLHKILREKWNYSGLVVSDWGGINSRVDSAKYGLDLEMPGNNGVHTPVLMEAVKSKAIAISEIDKSVSRIIAFSKEKVSNLSTTYQYNKKEHHALAVEAAQESIVLLKNEESILPLKKHQSIAIIGQFAKVPRYQGTGSSKIMPTALETAYDNFKLEEAYFSAIQYADGYNCEIDHLSDQHIEQAVKVASEADVTVVFIGLPDAYESEGFDREHMRMPDSHNRLIEALLHVTKNIVVVLSNGSPIEMPWHERVKGIVETYLGGQGAGRAIVDILMGKVNPSGKLAETFAHCLEDYPNSIVKVENPRNILYKESVFIGYRYFDKVNKKVLFPFGHGLSYASFKLLNMSISSGTLATNETINVKATLKNTSHRAGKQVVQLYIKKENSVLLRPLKILKGFKKVYLEAGQEQELTFELAFSDFETAIDLEVFTVEPGSYTIQLGFSSEDIILFQEIVIKAPKINLKTYQNLDHHFNITDLEFLNWTDGKVVLPVKKVKYFTKENIVADIKSRFIGRILLLFIKKNIYSQYSKTEKTTAKMMYTFFKEMPLRNLFLLNVNIIDNRVITGFIDVLNKKYFRGLKGILSGFLKR